MIVAYWGLCRLVGLWVLFESAELGGSRANTWVVGVLTGVLAWVLGNGG